MKEHGTGNFVMSGVHKFNSYNPHKPVVSKTPEADIWLSSYDQPTNKEGQRGGCQQLLLWKNVCFLINKKEAESELIQVNCNEERKDLKAGRVYGCLL